MDLEILKDKFIGSLVGTAIGDALGMPIEGWHPHRIQAVYGEMREMLDGRFSAGSWTDDTEMMIGIAESLIENKGFNGEHMAHRFIANFNVLRGYGSGSRRVLGWIRSGEETWDTAGERVFGGSGSYGNGAAMRIAPVGVFYFDDPEELRSIAYKSSQITHTHPLGKEGAALQVYAIALAVNADPSSSLNSDTFLKQLNAFNKEETVYTPKLRKIQALLSEKSVDKTKVISELGNSVLAYESVPTAIYSFLANSDSFEEAVVYAVGLGGDTDTIGAMAGAISGAYHGVLGIPERWKNILEKRKYIEALAESLWSIKTQ